MALYDQPTIVFETQSAGAIPAGFAVVVQWSVCRARWLDLNLPCRLARGATVYTSVYDSNSLDVWSTTRVVLLAGRLWFGYITHKIAVTYVDVNPATADALASLTPEDLQMQSWLSVHWLGSCQFALKRTRYIIDPFWVAHFSNNFRLTPCGRPCACIFIPLILPVTILSITYQSHPYHVCGLMHALDICIRCILWEIRHGCIGTPVLELHIDALNGRN